MNRKIKEQKNRETEVSVWHYTSNLFNWILIFLNMYAGPVYHDPFLSALLFHFDISYFNFSANINFKLISISSIFAVPGGLFHRLPFGPQLRSGDARTVPLAQLNFNKNL